MVEINYFIAFSLGIFSTVHCLGMCGGIITALSLGLPGHVRQNRKIYVPIICTYNLGRVFSYAVAGAIAGIFGHIILNQFESNAGYFLIRLIAGLVLVMLGLHIAGWSYGIRHIEGLGMKLWKVVQPIGRHFLPVDSIFKALVMGCLWGWLPCGLVYSVLLWSVTSTDPLSGTVYMLCFGLGTLPGMITAGILSSSLQKFASRDKIRKLFGLFIICFGLISPWIEVHQHDRATGPEIHHAH